MAMCKAVTEISDESDDALHEFSGRSLVVLQRTIDLTRSLTVALLMLISRDVDYWCSECFLLAALSNL